MSNLLRTITFNGNQFYRRYLTLLEFQTINGWAKNEGWNPGIYESLPFYYAGSNAHTGLFSNNDKLIASLSAVRYAKDFAFLGLYIVDPKFREQGIGEILAKAALKELEDCPLIGINAVPQQVGNYQRKYGFIPLHNNSRWFGELRSQVKESISLGSEEKIKIIGKEDSDFDFKKLVDYDASIFFFAREVFLRKWIDMSKSFLLVAIQNGKICGYGVASECVQGYKISPLFANNERIAERLYTSFASLLKGKIVQLDIPETNQSAVKLATKFGLYKTFDTKRMYRGKAELIEQQTEPNNQIYSLTSLEIG